MATRHLHRVLIVTNNARKAALTTWWVSNIDPNGATTFDQGLSATGSAPATHWWACAALTNAQVRAVLNRRYATASMTPPEWNSLTRAQIRTRLATDRAALVAASGVRMWHCNNDDAWDDFAALRAASGLSPVGAAA